jgi:phosphate transport system permease protein
MGGTQVSLFGYLAGVGRRTVAGGRDRLRKTERHFEERTRGELAVEVLGGGSLVAAIAAFVQAPELVAFPLVAFLLVTGYGWFAHQEVTARLYTFSATVGTVLTLGLITVYLFAHSLPIFQMMGLDIVTNVDKPWWVDGQVYSMVPMMYGTFVTTMLALLVCGPLGIAGAIYINEIASGTIREIVKPGVEILAGIPSIVYGYIGFKILNSYMRDEFLQSGFGSLLVAGLVVGVMALPTVVSIGEDALETVPNSMKDGSVAMGATDWQTMKSITIPAAFSGLSETVMLGLRRAIGEAMAATAILGGAIKLPGFGGLGDTAYWDIIRPGETLTTLIANNYGSASQTSIRALFAAGVILFVTVAILSITSQYIENRMQKKLRGER